MRVTLVESEVETLISMLTMHANSLVVTKRSKFLLCLKSYYGLASWENKPDFLVVWNPLFLIGTAQTTPKTTIFPGDLSSLIFLVRRQCFQSSADGKWELETVGQCLTPFRGNTCPLQRKYLFRGYLSILSGWWSVNPQFFCQRN